ncbi:hypothetical protein SAMN02927900_06286 [Rhizobium mongolense subsp. loessense]|uniref:Uncharacterized protein n=1 Tax=Rhizobium mongolense subsp. loessense TaxID=158890 RepID=A0A1G4U906_9HYPH|nr:hypothetical protein SAMN02927900_06286 [Rhizobium mongolense subsp. loessense]
MGGMAGLGEARSTFKFHDLDHRAGLRIDEHALFVDDHIAVIGLIRDREELRCTFATCDELLLPVQSRRPRLSSFTWKFDPGRLFQRFQSLNVRPGAVGSTLTLLLKYLDEVTSMEIVVLCPEKVRHLAFEEAGGTSAEGARP